MLQPMKRQQNVQNSPVLQMMRWSVDAICEKMQAQSRPKKNVCNTETIFISYLTLRVEATLLVGSFVHSRNLANFFPEIFLAKFKLKSRKHYRI
jgi:hypothetical protein